MKSILLLFTILLFTIQSDAQFCSYNYSYYVQPGTNTVTLSPHSYYSGVQYHYLWDFGDSTTSTLSNPTHIFSTSNPYVVCYTVYDSLNNIVCTNCDYVYLIPPYTCTLSYVPLASDSLFFSTQPLSGATIEWEFGDGTPNSTQNPVTHVYTHVGHYNMIVYNKDSAGNIICQHPEVIIIFNTHGCNFTYTTDPLNQFLWNFYSTTPGGYTVDWNFGDGTTGSGDTIQHLYATGGGYSVCFNAYNSLGDSCGACSNIVFGLFTSSCFFTAVADSVNINTYTFTDTLSNSTTYTTWMFGDQTTDTGNTVVHTYLNPGPYLVCMSRFDSTGLLCQRCDSVFGNSAACSFTSAMDALDSLTYNFSTTPYGYHFDWTFGDGTTASGSNPSHHYNYSGLYQVCMIESDTLSSSIVCQTCEWIQTFGPTDPCQPSFFASSQGLTTNFIDLSVTDTTVISYLWNFGDSVFSYLRFPQHTYMLPGTYNACLTVNTANCTDVFCNNVTVDTNTVINPLCNAFFAIVQIAPYQLTVVDLSTGSGIVHSWDFGDGSSDTTSNPTHYYPTTGSYNLCLTVSDGSGCTSTYCDTMNVDSLGNVYKLAQQGFTIVVMSPDEITTGVQQLNPSSQFKLFPNPFESEFYFTSNIPVESYRIYSMLGSNVSSGKIDGKSGRINASLLSQGTYLLEAKLGDGSLIHRIVIKK